MRGAKRKPRHERPAQATEFRQKSSERLLPLPGQGMRSPQSSHASSIPYAPRFPQDRKRKAPWDQRISTRVTPRPPRDSYPIPPRKFHPNPFVPAHRFPSRNNFTRLLPVHVPKNSTLRHSAHRPEFHRGQNYDHYRPFKRRRTDFNEGRRYHGYHQTYSRQNNFDVSVRRWRDGRVEINARRCGY